MKYTPVSIGEYIEEQKLLLAELEKEPESYVYASYLQGKKDLLKIVIADLEVITAGEVEVPFTGKPIC